jgi:NTE family protein
MNIIGQKQAPFHHLVLLLVVLLCTSCSVFSGRDRVAPREPEKANSATGKSLTTPFVEIDGNEGDAFVGIAVSGGGSRAANFAASVLAELDRMGVLRKVTAVSSVSGGSVAASYFVLHGSASARTESPAQFWIDAKEKLSQDFRSMWLARWLRPDQLATTLLTGTTRTDILADIFDEAFIGGATFSQLPKGSPALFINSTVVNDQAGRLLGRGCTNRGQYSQRLRWDSISFTDEFFSSCLNASFDTFRVSTAVAASAALPGVFNSVTLKKFDRQTGDPSFVHLIDGGPSDNLGMDGLLGAIVPEGRMFSETPKACLIIVIDAFTIGDADLRNEQADIRGALGRVIDLNFFDSVDALLARRRHDTLQRLGLPPTRQLDMFGGYLQKQDYPLEGQLYSLLRPAKRFTPSVSAAVAIGEPRDADGVHCAVWHVALDNVPSMMAGQGVVGGELVTLYDPKSYVDKFIQTENWFARPEVQHRIRVYELASRLRTDFNLVGPRQCKREQLRDAIWEAGRLAVQDDLSSRRAVCQWFRARGWLVAADCDAPPAPPPPLPFPIVFKAVGAQSSSFDIACTHE